MGTEPDACDPIAVGLVLYARHLSHVGRFYATVAGMDETQREQDFVVLERDAFQLVVVAVPDDIGRRIVIDEPPRRRTDTPVKPVFVVRDIEALRELVAELGGALDPSEKTWRFGCWRVLDGHDPEGNVFQLREGNRPHE